MVLTQYAERTLRTVLVAKFKAGACEVCRCAAFAVGASQEGAILRSGLFCSGAPGLAPEDHLLSF